MTKLKTTLLGVALSLPLVAFGAMETAGTTGIEAALPVEQGPSQAYECCWVYYNGMWWCIPYC